MSQTPDKGLRHFIARELANTPLAKWGYYFPLLLAMWQYVEERYPGILGELRAVYRDEPELSGEGAEWFGDALMNNNEVVDVLDAISYSVFDALPNAVKDRGTVTERELPDLDGTLIERLQTIIDASVQGLAK